MKYFFLFCWIAFSSLKWTVHFNYFMNEWRISTSFQWLYVPFSVFVESDLQNFAHCREMHSIGTQLSSPGCVFEWSEWFSNLYKIESPISWKSFHFKDWTSVFCFWSSLNFWALVITKLLESVWYSLEVWLLFSGLVSSLGGCPFGISTVTWGFDCPF